MALTRDVADGIHRIEDAYTNWYLVEDGAGRLTIADTGVPTSWGSLEKALREIGRTPGDVDAVVLTHAHFDHVGFAEKARSQFGVPIHVHTADVALTKHPLRYDHERPRALYATQFRALPIAASLIRNRALLAPAVKEVVTYEEGVLSVPGSPRVIPTPGHTYGHCSLHFPDRNAVIAGDAIVTLNPYRGTRGPQIVSGAATADSKMNLASLDALAATGAQTVLTGHGEPWTDGVESAVAKAHAAGAS